MIGNWNLSPWPLNFATWFSKFCSSKAQASVFWIKDKISYQEEFCSIKPSIITSSTADPGAGSLLCQHVISSQWDTEIQQAYKLNRQDYSWHSSLDSHGTARKGIQVLCLSSTFNMHFSLLIQEQSLKGITESENTIFLMNQKESVRDGLRQVLSEGRECTSGISFPRGVTWQNISKAAVPARGFGSSEHSFQPGRKLCL